MKGDGEYLAQTLGIDEATVALVCRRPAPSATHHRYRPRGRRCPPCSAAEPLVRGRW